MLGKMSDVEKVFYIRRYYLRGTITIEHALRNMFRATGSYRKVAQYLLEGCINAEQCDTQD